MERVNQSPEKQSSVAHNPKTCPFAARVQALETQLAYYKAICLAYESGRLKAQGSYRRLTIQKNQSKQDDEKGDGILSEVQGFKEQQQKFSEHIQKKIKKGVQKKSQEIPMHQSQINFSNKSRASLKYTQQELNYFTKSSLQVPVLGTSNNANGLQNADQENKQQDQIETTPITTFDVGCSESRVVTQLVENIQMIKVISEDIISEKSSENQKTNKPRLPLIADLCVFGCTDKALEQLPNEKVVEVDPSLLFSMLDFNSKMYYDHVSKYLFPNGLFSRKMRNEKLLGQVNQILLQNIKKHSNFIYQLKSQLSLQDIPKQQRQLIKRINPTLNLYCISIKINDFTIIDSDHILSDKEKSPQTSEADNTSNITNKDINKNGQISNRSDNYIPRKNRELKDLKNYTVYSNKRVVSIFTYYPFFQFFQSFLISIYNALKVQKLGIYQNKLDTVFDVDSNYMIKQLQSTYTSLVSQINNTVLVPGLDYEFTLGVDILKISTDGHRLSEAWLGYWIYPILHLFDKNTFYDTLSALLYEDQLIFVCDNQHILSFVIYLFSQILPRPFHYQHTIIYMVSEWALLDAPTPIVLGVNKPSQWLEENMRDGHLYVQIGEQVTLIDKRKDSKRIRSQKLRKMSSTFFKKIDKDTSMSIFKEKKKKDGVQYSMNSTKQQKQLCLHFITQLTSFFKQQLIDRFPNEMFINGLKEKYRVKGDKDQDIATFISEEIIKEMVKGRKEKDLFVQKLMRSQLFLTYLFDVSKLDE